MKRIYFIRHVPTKYNQLNYWCGQHSNIHIDPNWKFSDETIKLLSSIHFDKIYVSPLDRCLETFKVLNLKQNYTIDNRLIERDFGRLEDTPCIGNQKDELANWNLNADLNQGVEKIQDMFFKRIKPFIDEIKNNPENNEILIISHSWVGRLLKYYFSNNIDSLKTAPKNGEVLCFKID